MAGIEVATVRTLTEARDFVVRVGLCYLFSDPKGVQNSLWDAVDAPDKQPGEGGWGDKMGKVWNWKDELPYTYPDEIFYGKLKGGRAFLCTMPELRRLYAATHKPLTALSAEANALYAIVRDTGPVGNPHLRATAHMASKDNKARYERALTDIQVAFYIVRVVDPPNQTWYWDAFARRHPQVADAATTE